ncbi:unnamed protein product [Amoebophrya sp. A120]|nr:unnamed protein product [Amoebophrya sp. A120]|eukprot:GSA120T00004695001.1
MGAVVSSRKKNRTPGGDATAKPIQLEEVDLAKGEGYSPQKCSKQGPAADGSSSCAGWKASGGPASSDEQAQTIAASGLSSDLQAAPPPAATTKMGSMVLDTEISKALSKQNPELSTTTSSSLAGAGAGGPEDLDARIQSQLEKMKTASAAGASSSSSSRGGPGGPHTTSNAEHDPEKATHLLKKKEEKAFLEMQKKGVAVAAESYREAVLQGFLEKSEAGAFASSSSSKGTAPSTSSPEDIATAGTDGDGAKGKTTDAAASAGDAGDHTGSGSSSGNMNEQGKDTQTLQNLQTSGVPALKDREQVDARLHKTTSTRSKLLFCWHFAHLPDFVPPEKLLPLLQALDAAEAKLEHHWRVEKEFKKSQPETEKKRLKQEEEEERNRLKFWTLSDLAKTRPDGLEVVEQTVSSSLSKMNSSTTTSTAVRTGNTTTAHTNWKEKFENWHFALHQTVFKFTGAAKLLELKNNKAKTAENNPQHSTTRTAGEQEDPEVDVNMFRLLQTLYLDTCGRDITLKAAKNRCHPRFGFNFYSKEEIREELGEYLLACFLHESNFLVKEEFFAKAGELIRESVV